MIGGSGVDQLTDVLTGSWCPALWALMKAATVTGPSPLRPTDPHRPAAEARVEPATSALIPVRWHTDELSDRGVVVVELAELIGDLRDELSRAVAAANPPDGLRFELGPVELELTVAVAREAKPGAKVRFWVVEAGAEGSINKAATQKLTLTLQPTVAGRSAYVSGAAEAEED